MTPIKTVVLKLRLTVLTVCLALLAVSPAFAQLSTNILLNSAKSMALVDVNNADVTALQSLPGVGPVTAKRIVDGRPYQSLSDLGKVKGLSDSKLSALKNMVTFGAATNAVSNMVSTAKSNVASVSNTVSHATNNVVTSSRHSLSSVSQLAPGQVLDINTASAADLDKLPGVGPVKAQAIVDYRTKNGNFKSVDDLQKVKGIKADTFAKLKDYVKVSN